jgi:hypothetical protein
MKMSSEQLYRKELELIAATSHFIQNMYENIIQKDISSTQESMSFDPTFDDEDAFSQSSQSRLLLRKSRSNTNLRRTENGLCEALREV